MEEARWAPGGFLNKAKGPKAVCGRVRRSGSLESAFPSDDTSVSFAGLSCPEYSLKRLPTTPSCPLQGRKGDAGRATPILSSQERGDGTALRRC